MFWPSDRPRPGTVVHGRLIGVAAAGLAAGALVLATPAPVTGESEHWAAPASNHVAPALAPQSCVRCHAIDQTFSHPVNFAPSRALSSDFPLQNGQLTCTTCHLVGPRHRHRRGNPGLRTGTTGTAFCAQCHDRTDVDRASMHAFVLGVAHTRLPNRDDTGAPPDFAGTSCLTCHDGSLAISSNHRNARAADFASGTHPFAIEYRLSDPDAFDGPLTPAASLDHRIRLSDGQLDCGSCHSLYSPIENLLVMENRGSALCLSCHQY